MHVTKEQIRQARKANLADYLLREYPADVKIVGTSLCLRRNPSLYVKKSIPGYLDFATGEHGNSIDFLTRHLHYSFTDAVAALCRISAPSFNVTAGTKPFALPQRAERPFRQVLEYLTGRGISEGLVMHLIQEQLLYQDLRGNAVFVDPDESYCEIRGTGAENHFHGCRKKASDRFWYFLTAAKPETVYICEAAIDALSLMLIHQSEGRSDPAAYVSIGGVANQRTIDRLKRKHGAVLAVDNDRAGEECRKRNPDLLAMIPDGKDWNEDLQRNRSS